MFMAGPKMMRAAAIVHSSSSSGGSAKAAIAVPFLGWKFWMISSCRQASAFKRSAWR